MLYLIGQLICAFVSGWTLLTIMDALYDRKYLHNKLCYWSCFLVYAVLSVIVANYEIPGLNLLFSMAILSLLSWFLFENSPKSILLNSAVVIVYFALVDLIVTTIFSIFAGVNTIMALTDSRYFLMSGIFNSLAMLCTYNLLIHLITHTHINKFSKYMHVYTLFLLVFELGFLCYFIDNSKCPPDNWILLVLAIGFVAVDGSIIYLFKLISQNAILEKKNKLIEQQSMMTVKYYESLKKQNGEMQRLAHDFKKHLQVIENLEDGKGGSKKIYIEELMNHISSTQQQFKCEDEIICTILWEKIQICKQEHIFFEPVLQDAKFDFMEKSEVTSLFANLLDNAIEACIDSKKDKKEIYFRVHKYKDHIVIKMKNTIGIVPSFKGGQLQSTKPEHLGMGMTVLDNIVEKYCGNIDYNYSNDYFETKIIIASEITT